MIPWPRTRRAGTFEEYKRILTALFEYSGGSSCIDLGCGEAHVTQHFRGSILVDTVRRPSLQSAVWEIDMREVPGELTKRGSSPIDMMLMSDSIEHLTKDDGNKLIFEMAIQVRLRVIFAPVGAWHVQESSLHPDAHKSAWHPEEFREHGWEVWEWPSFHRYENGECLGAFWAWRGSDQPTVADIAEKAGIKI